MLWIIGGGVLFWMLVVWQRKRQLDAQHRTAIHIARRIQERELGIKPAPARRWWQAKGYQ